MNDVGHVALFCWESAASPLEPLPNSLPKYKFTPVLNPLMVALI